MGCCLVMSSGILVNTGLGNGLLPDGTKPLPEPMLTYHQCGTVTITWGKFRERYLSPQSVRLAWKLPKISLKSPRGQLVKLSLLLIPLLPQPRWVTDIMRAHIFCSHQHKYIVYLPKYLLINGSCHLVGFAGTTILVPCHVVKSLTHLKIWHP